MGRSLWNIEQSLGGNVMVYTFKALGDPLILHEHCFCSPWSPSVALAKALAGFSREQESNTHSYVSVSLEKLLQGCCN